MKLRLASTETDIPAVTSLINPYETNPVTVDQVRAWFEHNPPERITRRLVSVDDQTRVTGYSVINHEASVPEHHFHIWMVVQPELRAQGIGSALWEASLDFLREQIADRLVSEVREQDAEALKFAQKRGFSIERYMFDSILDLGAFDEAPYLPAIAALETQGIRFCSLADFPDTAETRHKLFDLNVINVLDIPGVDGVNPWTFESFEEFILSAPWFKREGQLLAVEGDTWVGLSAVSLNPESGNAYNEHTGVLRAYRGRKIAQSLKVLAARYARNQGAQSIRTDNDSLNAPILAINKKMGYQPQQGKYLLIRWL
jgi:ribosomal protein S18 acetylase RimI-like enzyme